MGRRSSTYEINKKVFNKGICFSLCVIDIFRKYPRVTPLKDEKGITSINTFKKYLDESNCKPKKMLVNKCYEFYNR